jgi:hypothetical protein
LIHKVNRPELQLIISSPKATENDPGSSQGGGVAYEKLPQPKDSESEPKESRPHEVGASPTETPTEDPVASLNEQIGLGEMVREFKESHKPQPVRPGLATHYQSESGNAKGLLLNKKVE